MSTFAKLARMAKALGGDGGPGSSPAGPANSVVADQARRRGGGDEDNETPTLDAVPGEADMVFELDENGEVVLSDGPDMEFTVEDTLVGSVTTDPTYDQEMAQERLDAIRDPSLTQEERVIAADNSRAELECSLLGLEHVDDEQRERILARVEGLEGDALIREMDMIENALSGPNADRAMRTLSDLEALREENPEQADRLNPDIVSALVGGVADARSDSARGQEGIMGRRQASTAARTLMAMNDDNFTDIENLMDMAGGAEGSDAGAERALILEAVASRSGALQTDGFDDVAQMMGGSTPATEEMQNITEFADAIRGMDRTELLRTTTLTDIHDENTSLTNPEDLFGEADTTGDNDGLFQRFEDSCGPTTAQILRGEMDPMYALALHEQGLDDPDPQSLLALEQRQILEAGDGTALARTDHQMGPRVVAQMRENLTPELDRMQEEGDLTADQREQFRHFLRDPDSLEEEQRHDAQKLLDQLRTGTEGHPSDEELEMMRRGLGESEGMALEDALDPTLGPVTGDTYTNHEVDFEDDVEHLDDVAERLRDGEDVPIRIEYEDGAGHFMSITDVRTDESGGRCFLIADPWTGSARWITQADFTSDGAIGNLFDLGSARVSDTYERAEP